MLKTNTSNLVKISVLGEIANPHMSPLPASPYMVSAEGEPLLLPMFGGLVYNVRLGDPALGWAAELIQPGVSIKHKDGPVNTALGVYACVGNRAMVMGGMAAGAKGMVIGKSSRFAEHVICSFAPEALEKMAPEDPIQVQAYGVGLKLEDYPDVMVKNCSPELFAALGVREENGRVMVPVKGIVGSEYGGAGAGFNSANRVVSLMTSDAEVLKKFGLADLRFGDLVAITDWDSRFNHGYLRGSVSIGVVCQGNSFRTGFGPALTVLFTGKADVLTPVAAEAANLLDFMPG